MIMQLADRWRIDIKGLNWTLQELVDIKGKDGKPKQKWQFRGYYPGMNTILKVLPDWLMLSPSIVTYEQYLEEWDATRKQITERFRK